MSYRLRGLTDAVFAQITDTDDLVHSYFTLCRESAARTATTADEVLKGNPIVARLPALPLAAQGRFSHPRRPTTCGSKILEDFMPPYDATTSRRLRARRGAVIIGKTNLDEFAMGSSTENSAFFPTRNPWDLDARARRLSGGSAAAVAADLARARSAPTPAARSASRPPSAASSGSSRPMAAYALRLIAFASSLDQVGPFARRRADAALLLEAIAGHDPRIRHRADRSGARLRGGA